MPAEEPPGPAAERAAATMPPGPAQSAGAMLALQHAYGNRRVARWLLSRAPTLTALEQASPSNRELAAEIDAVRKLDWVALIERHEEVETALSAGPTGTALTKLLLTRDAIDFVRAERMKGGWTPPYPGSATNQAAGLRGAALREIQRAGSVDYGLEAFEKRFKGSEEAKRQATLIRAERDAFAKAFESQAKNNARQILETSEQSIYELMRAYGLPRRTRVYTEDTDKFERLANEWMQLIKTDTEFAASGAATHRKRLAQWVTHLQKKQDKVHHADRGAKSDVDDPVGTKAEQDRARNELAGTWLEAERLHPILAAYRTGKPLESIDLNELAIEGDQAMRALLMKVLPTMGNILEARRWLKSGKLKPLTLAPVVELTRQHMFVPPGSFRAAVVADLVADAGSGGLALALITLALTLVLLLPTGGASGLILPGLLMLDVYSAGTQYVQYGMQKALRGTDLDRARALSNQDPSLTGLVISLISAGLGGAQLINVFRQAQAVRNLALAGGDTRPAVKALNKVGEDLGAGDLGSQAAATARKGRPAPASADRPPTPEPPASTVKKPTEPERPPSAPTEKPSPPKTEKPTPKTERPSTPRTAPPGPTIETLTLGYASKEQVKAAVKAEITAIRGKLPERWDLVKDALRATDGKANRELLGLLDSHMAALRDPEKWAEVLSEAWEIASKMPTPDMRGALIELAKRKGLGVPKPVAKVLRGTTFFDDYVTSGLPLIDKAFKGELHGELTHLIQDLVINAKLGAGASARFRKLLGEAEGWVERWAPGAKSNTVTATSFGAHRGPTANVTFLEGESRMRTGDYVWRWTYDLLYLDPKLRRLPQPEAVGPKLDELLELQ